MKIRHIKRRSKRPDFRVTRVLGTKWIEVKSAAAAERFFRTTAEEDQKTAEFFGIDAQIRAAMSRAILNTDPPRPRTTEEADALYERGMLKLWGLVADALPSDRH